MDKPPPLLHLDPSDNPYNSIFTNFTERPRRQGRQAIPQTPKGAKEPIEEGQSNSLYLIARVILIYLGSRCSQDKGWRGQEEVERGIENSFFLRHTLDMVYGEGLYVRLL